MGTVLESIYGLGSNQRILASVNSGALINPSQPYPLATLLDPVPGSGPGYSADSRKVRRRRHESFSTDRLPCAVCQVKSIECFYQNHLSSCEGCRTSKIRCIKQMPLGQHNHISPSFVDTSMEAEKDLGKSGERGIKQHRSVVNLTRDTEVTGPTLPVPSPYPRPPLNRPKTDNCAWCLGPEGYRFLCETYGHQYSTRKLDNTYPNVQPPNNNHRAHQALPALNGKPEGLNRDVAVAGPLETTPDHHPTAQKRKISASLAVQDDQDAVEGAKNIETSQEHRVRLAREYEELMMRNG